MTRFSRLAVAVTLGIWMPACDSPISPDERSYGLAGVVRDRSAQPIADARIEITDGPFAGRFTTSNAAGEFQFDDPRSVSELVTLWIFKPGYRSAYARPDRFRIVVTLLSMDDQHSITFTAAETCSALPSSVRSRSYTTTLWDFTPGSHDLALTGADFFPGLSTMGALIRDSRAQFSVSSEEAFRRWGDELPIYERIGASGYLSLLGTAALAITPSQTSFRTSFDGTIAYCPTAREPIGDGFPPQCTVAEIQCRSDSHQFAGSPR